MAIRAANVTLTLGSEDAAVDILRGVDLNVPYGTSVALLGPSGSGKSSLMAVLAGLERASGGSVEVDGLNFTTLDEDALARARRGRIGIVFGRAAKELEAVGLGHRMTHYPSQLSGGEQQRVAIARAMAAAPKIIFADEPTGNLDGATGGSIIDLLFERRAALGATLLIITHDPELARKCDRVIAMQDGLVVKA
jgi:putative ABC transport system ATP-binding protein